MSQCITAPKNACVTANDWGILTTDPDLSARETTCNLSQVGDLGVCPDFEIGVSGCLMSTAGLSGDCGSCYALRTSCIGSKCPICVAAPTGDACKQCTAASCDPAFDKCRGVKLSICDAASFNSNAARLTALSIPVSSTFGGHPNPIGDSANGLAGVIETLVNPLLAEVLTGTLDSAALPGGPWSPLLELRTTDLTAGAKFEISFYPGQIKEFTGTLNSISCKFTDDDLPTKSGEICETGALLSGFKPSTTDCNPLSSIEVTSDGSNLLGSAPMLILPLSPFEHRLVLFDVVFETTLNASINLVSGVWLGYGAAQGLIAGRACTAPLGNFIGHLAGANLPVDPKLIEGLLDTIALADGPIPSNPCAVVAGGPGGLPLPIVFQFKASPTNIVAACTAESALDGSCWP